MKLIIRCEQCSKILTGEVEKSQSSGVCPRCGHQFTITAPISHDGRKHKRVVVGESQFAQSIPETLTQNREDPVYRVMYTEVPPVEFALKRSDYVPLLDLSKGGMGVLSRADDQSSELLPGDKFVAEIDFPILVQSIFVQVELRWIRLIKEGQLRHTGVQFCHPDEPLQSVIQCLMNYIQSRTQTPDCKIWGSFG